MDIRGEVAHVRQLSDDDLLASLSGAVGSSRRLLAVVIAHLGEVEERRLHLLTGHESMFAYCTRRLGMSEDEACRRIDVARLARRFPLLLEHLAGEHVSLSVAALLKAHLDDDIHVALLEAVSGKTVNQAREVIAAWFPLPDVAASIRKLPDRRFDAAGSRGMQPASPLFESVAAGQASEAPPSSQAGATNTSTACAAPPQAALEPVDPERQRRTPLPPANRKPPTIEPLSPERYRIQFTAGAELKQKLDLAQDLLRHAVPLGDLASIVGRALDLLIERTLQRRFGQTKKKKPPTTAAPSADRPKAPSNPAPTSPVSAPTPASPSRHIPNEVRRTVLERDGLRCTWQGPDNTRCNSRAWLEHDHVVPRGMGGTDAPENIRPLCKAHNRLAAEQVYGQATITRIIAGRRARRAKNGTPPSAAR